MCYLFIYLILTSYNPNFCLFSCFLLIFRNIFVSVVLITQALLSTPPYPWITHLPSEIFTPLVGLTVFLKFTPHFSPYQTFLVELLLYYCLVVFGWFFNLVILISLNIFLTYTIVLWLLVYSLSYVLILLVYLSRYLFSWIILIPSSGLMSSYFNLVQLLFHGIFFCPIWSICINFHILITLHSTDLLVHICNNHYSLL